MAYVIVFVTRYYRVFVTIWIDSLIKYSSVERRCLTHIIAHYGNYNYRQTQKKQCTSPNSTWYILLLAGSRLDLFSISICFAIFCVRQFRGIHECLCPRPVGIHDVYASLESCPSACWHSSDANVKKSPQRARFRLVSIARFERSSGTCRFLLVIWRLVWMALCTLREPARRATIALAIELYGGQTFWRAKRLSTAKPQEPGKIMTVGELSKVPLSRVDDCSFVLANYVNIYWFSWVRYSWRIIPNVVLFIGPTHF